MLNSMKKILVLLWSHSVRISSGVGATDSSSESQNFESHRGIANRRNIDWYLIKDIRYCAASGFDLNLCRLRNKLFKLILITLDRSFRMKFISFLNEVWEEREARPILTCWVLSKEASGTIFITSLVWRSLVNKKSVLVISVSRLPA